MGFVMAYYIATFVVILITHETIFPVKGQCTVQGCDNGDPLISIVAEIQQLRVDLFDQLNKQVQNIHELLNASFQELKSQHGTVDQRSQEQEIFIKQVQSFQEFLNESFQEMKSLQVVDRRSLQEHDICLKQVQSIRELLNESVQQTKSQHDTVMNSLQDVDRRSEEQDIYIKQVQYIHEFLNESVQQTKSQHHAVMTNLQAIDRRRFQEHAINIKQGQSIHELLNESFQEIKSQQGTVMTSLQSVDRRSQEHDICIKQVPRIHELLNESFQQIKSQYDSVNFSLQAVDQRLQTYQIDIMNQTQKSWKLVNAICDPPVRDCSDIKARGHTVNGVYEVCVGHPPNRVCTNAFCDMETTNSALLVFQRRKDGSVNFNRTWTEYKQGFGNITGEFWLGNEMLYLLTSNRNYKLRVDLEDFHGNKSFAEYTPFSIDSSADKYRLTIGGYSGTAGDSLNHNNRKQFITISDGYSGICAWQYGGAWWHGGGGFCSYACLNGIYYQRYDTVKDLTGIHWYSWHKSSTYSLKATEMKLVPVA